MDRTFTWEEVLSKDFAALAADPINATHATLRRVIAEFMEDYGFTPPSSNKRGTASRLEDYKQQLKLSGADPKKFALWCESYYQDTLERRQ